MSDKIVINAMKSAKYGARLNAIKHEVEAVTFECKAISAEVEGLTHTGTMGERLKRAIRVQQLQKRLKKMERRGDKLETEWNILLHAFMAEAAVTHHTCGGSAKEQSLQVVKR